MIMALKFKGKVWVFGDNLDVDKEIIPFREREMGLMKDGNFGKWVMTPVDPDFPKKVKKGDIMVVGTNMGCGHGHWHANIGIKQAGISCVIAESFDRNFFKNSVNMGLPIIELEGINKVVKEGDELAVDLEAGTVKNLTNKKTLKFTPLPDFLLEIMAAGGIEPYTNKLIAEGKI
jgi:3-isopropylmalate/(R)-2-methylmalate dehydratase small subunit